ncbi:Alkaline_phosphatase [Hexamita inflata]|uniref:Alkaline phosphatase n=1 Tax=Hexamita inflata TaxID=28002 RepID=A0AA86UHT6_9EUKA|nr:Alkaline phosphatase [Hexamita inflata]
MTEDIQQEPDALPPEANLQNNNQPEEPVQQVNKWSVVLNHILVILELVLLTISLTYFVLGCCYFDSKVKYFSYLDYGAYNFLKTVFCNLFIAIIIFLHVLANKPGISLNKRIIYLSSMILIVMIVISLLITDIVIFRQQFNNLAYGPIQIVSGNGTQIHWFTDTKTQSVIKVDQLIIANSTKSHFHNVQIPSTQFKYSILSGGISSAMTQYFGESEVSYSLTQTPNKFIVMSDIHSNNKYIKNMNEEYDFALLCGDYSSGGKSHEFSWSFKHMPKKPMLLAVGNHDILGDAKYLVPRKRNFYQNIGGIGFYHIYVLNNANIFTGSLVSRKNVDIAMDFLYQTFNQSDQRAFIISHKAVYSSGGYGTNKYFATRMEQFLDLHKQVKAVFSGHDHIFSAYMRNGRYTFVNGAGGGSIDNTKLLIGRKWSNEIHGPLRTSHSDQYGNQNHLDSYALYTRTEVELFANRITYTVRNLESQDVIQTYVQED